MVRSNSEGPDRKLRELFHLVDRFREQEKYFDVSRQEIVRQLASEGYCEFLCVHEVEDENGEAVGAELRLNIARRKLQRWSVSLKLHKTRIDCIDYEARADLPEPMRIGWHRHGWDAKARSAESIKIPLAGFGEGLTSAEEFLIRAFREMRILLNSSDDGTSSLPFA